MGRYEGCEPDDPRRCQAVAKHGQCTHLAVAPSKYCKPHGLKGDVTLHKARVQHYRINDPALQDSMKRQSELEEVRSLREEIHLVRSMIEMRLNLVDDEDRGAMLLAFSSVNTYMQTLEKLVSSCHRMEVSLGSLLTKAAIFSLGQEIVIILADELQGIDNYEEIVDRISERVVVAIANQENENKKP